MEEKLIAHDYVPSCYLGICISNRVIPSLADICVQETGFFPRPLIFVVVIISFYFVGMTLYKDIPDIEGDKTFGINSIAARIGLKPAFWISISLIEMAVGVALLAGATSSSCLWIKIVTGLGHIVLASIIWYKAKSVDLKSNASIFAFYVFLWKLIGVEHFLLPFIR
ncbi:hypothetical protein Fmac_020363 [Flemingia macrophylla]|uniref:Uncharacterized protein n=1 Tax=Flemingia macrophylla TaxID=520843 RepID=A0ABD1LTT0_9FABA